MMVGYSVQKMLYLLFFISVLSKTTHSCPTLFEDTINVKAEKINYRLPQNIQPIRYNITLEPRLEPNLNPAPFTGAVTIELKPLENTLNITLHTRQLNISENSISVVDSNGSDVKFSNTLRDDTREFYIIQFETFLVKGEKYILTIKHYTGILHLDNGGFYLAKYYDSRGRERRFATTQFQSTGARRAFPSFDEPPMKATFIANLIRNENFTSVSNEELAYTINLGNGKFQDTYKETVTMSTYLVAFVVSDYKHTNLTEGHRVFADEESIANGQAEYALRVGIDVLNSLGQFLDTNYTLNKMDQIAIPDDYFAPGAMENWGLVTYRKSYLVYPTENATTSEIQKTVQIIAHEFAHQWFGNLITCSWWRYIWLNEGFANYFESYAAALVRPTWRLMDVFVLTSLQKSFESDSLNSTKPMNHETDYPGGGPPSYIAYQKAGSVIRMFEHFLTHNIFKKALTLYLQNNAFGSVQPPDLYRALQEVVDTEKAGFLLGNLTVSSIMETWDSQEGYPVVNVTRDYETGHILLQQRRFLLKHTSTKYNNTWYIPINYQFHSANASDSTTADFWMTEKSQTLNHSFPNSSWLIVNKQQTGFYRVNYDITNWNRLIHFLNTEDIDTIHLLNRAQLIDDSFNLARAGQLHYHVPLNLSKYLTRETDYIPLTSFFNNLNFLNTMLAATTEYTVFENYINNSLVSAYKHLGFTEEESDEHLDKLNRINVLKWLCKVNNEECRKKSLAEIRIWKQSNINPITPNLDLPILCGGLRIGNQDDWNFLYQKYESAGNTSQRGRILNALGCSENTDILNSFLDMVLNNSSTLRATDRFSAFTAVLNAGNTGLNFVFDYIDKNFAELQSRINLQAIVLEIGSKFTTNEQLNRLINIANKHSDHKETFKTAIENTKENIQWSEKYIGAIKTWLLDYSQEK